MVEVPHLDHLCRSQKEHHNNEKVIWCVDKLNNLELWGADIGNAYLEAPTEEKLYIVAGPEFGDWEGYILTFSKALYGLKSSGKDGQKLHMIY